MTTSESAFVDATALRPTFDAFFRFQIGDHVIERVTLEAAALEADINGPGKSYERLSGIRPGSMVIERMIQQCHGGFQGFYLVRRWNDKGQELLVRFIEHELALWNEIAPALRAMAPEKKA